MALGLVRLRPPPDTATSGGRATAVSTMKTLLYRTTKTTTQRQFFPHALGRLLALLLWGNLLAHAASSDPTFSFQGRLSDQGQPANGAYELEFQLFDSAVGGHAIGPANTRSNVSVTNGLFQVLLSFGSSAFDGSPRWLEIAVRAESGSEPTILDPRTPLSATPYALHANLAETVPDGAITSEKLAAGAVHGSKIVPGSIGGAQIANGAIGANHVAAGAVQSMHLSSGAVTAEKLGAGSAAANLLSGGQSPIGSGGVILSESASRPELLQAGFVLLSKVDLVSEAWRSGPPAPLPAPSTPISLEAGPAVWTGSEMLVWGGGDIFGARYNPTAGTWTSMTTNNVPAKRSFNSAIWTGTEMIIWGGQLSGAKTPTATGARYNPANNTWTALPTANAPGARHHHSATWTGTEMIVWGGIDAAGNESNTGGRFNPISNTWTPLATANAPSPRHSHTAIWDGSSVIVWGGAVSVTVTNTNAILTGNPSNPQLTTIEVIHHPDQAMNTGARYFPANNTWVTIPTNNAPSARALHTAVWSGTQMIVWGGQQQAVVPVPSPLQPSAILWTLVTAVRSDGYRYNPANNTWTPISSQNSAGPRTRHTAVWTGTHMIVWGGSGSAIFTPGAAYQPSADAWTQIETVAQPTPRSGHSALWTGSGMVIWGGGKQNGGIYQPAQNIWTSTAPTGDAAERVGASPIWTGQEMIVWGGRDKNGLFLQSGLSYDPTKNTWRKLSLNGAPSARAQHITVWTGTEMIVWGGESGAGDLDDGARYNPATDTWTSLSSSNAPAGRRNASAIWTGDEMIVMGGLSGIGVVWNGARYHPATDRWMPLNLQGAPPPRLTFALQWTGHEMILWGGDSLGLTFSDGGRFDPVTSTWTSMSTANAPDGRHAPTSIWTGHELIVWGGGGTFGQYPSTGGRYQPDTDTWISMNNANAPAGREGHSLIWDGTKMYVFGGQQFGNTIPIGSAGAYVPAEDKWISYGNNETGRTQHAAVWTGLEMLIWGGYGTSGEMVNLTRLHRPSRSFYLYLRP